MAAACTSRVFRIARQLRFGLVLAGLCAAFLMQPTSHAQAPEQRLPPDLQSAVNKSIEKGRNFLLNQTRTWNQKSMGTWADKEHKHFELGYSALPGLVLLECGLPKNHAVIQAAAAFTRQKSLEHKGTYEISLAILFLDKLGYKADRGLIEILALRLMAGQTPTGGWSYKCPQLTSQQHTEILRLLKAKDFKYAAVPAHLNGVPILTDPKILSKADPKDKGNEPTFGTTDGSNTQFAILALWAARRHNVPVKRSLDLVVRRYETSQNKDGSWNYHYHNGGGANAGGDSASMTGVGLLGLAVGHGLGFDQRAADLPIPAFAFLNAVSQMAQPTVVPSTLGIYQQCKKTAQEKLQATAKDLRIPKGFASLTKSIGTPAGRHQNLPQSNLYFLWSVERVGVLYSLPTIGKKDWYHWGSEILVANQTSDGHWADGKYHGESAVINTCLALLFLNRANLATDLAQSLPFDPQQLTRDIVAQLPTGVASPTPGLPEGTTPPGGKPGLTEGGTTSPGLTEGGTPGSGGITPTPGNGGIPPTTPGGIGGNPTPKNPFAGEGEDFAKGIGKGDKDAEGKPLAKSPEDDLFALAKENAKKSQSQTAFPYSDGVPEDEAATKKPVFLLVAGGVCSLFSLIALASLLVFFIGRRSKNAKKNNRPALIDEELAEGAIPAPKRPVRPAPTTAKTNTAARPAPKAPPPRRSQ